MTGDVDGVFGRFPDEGEVDVHGGTEHLQANGVVGAFARTEQLTPFRFELDTFVEEDQVFAVEGFGGTEMEEGHPFEAVALETFFHRFHRDSAAATSFGLCGGGRDRYVGTGDTIALLLVERLEVLIEDLGTLLSFVEFPERRHDCDHLHGNHPREKP